LLVGLTATPRDDVGRDTYKLFGLEKGVPTDAYDLGAAVADGYLVPVRAVSVPVKFPREGISYDELSEEEKEEWDEAEWDDDGSPAPARVEPEAVNRWLFNKDTVDKVLAHLMTNGIKVAGGDRLGKTIIFAKNQAHANFIAERFNHHYPQWQGKFARVITFQTEYAQSLIDDFSVKDRPPHIAISVDMLDTGIDVPEIVNLVFFKMVRSKPKFWQMVGRGTRLCPDLFGPGQDKELFYVFDYCQNLEYFRQEVPAADSPPGDSLGKRLFVRRLELLGELDHRDADIPPTVTSAGASVRGADVIREAASYGDAPQDLPALRASVAGRLYDEVAAMNLDNFVVRPKRRLVEKYGKLHSWNRLSDDDRHELANEIAGLPSELPPDAEECKRFDLLMLNLQLAMLRGEPGFQRLRDQVKALAGVLEEKSAIPMVRKQLELLAELQTDDWWQDVTLPMLESVRRRVRPLVTLIEKAARNLIYIDIPDEIGSGTQIELPAFASAGAVDFEKFRLKARAFLRAHEDHVAIRKLRMNKPLTASDLAELERMLADSGVGHAGDLDHAKQAADGLGLFVRSLVGLDREAAKAALGDFLTGKTLSANQIEFVNLMIDQLTEQGMMPASALYESPFTDVAPHGPDGIFSPEQVDQLVATLDAIRAAAGSR